MSPLLDVEGKPLARYDEVKFPDIRIVGPRLLVLPASSREGFTESGLVIPAAAQDTNQFGVVLAVGEGIMLSDGSFMEPCCEVGDEILYARYSGTELEVEGVTYLIIQESDVRAVMTFRGKVIEFQGENPPAPPVRQRLPSSR